MSKTFFSLFLLLAMSFGAHAQSFKLVGDDDFPPFTFIDQGKQLTGIDIDILEELSARLDIEFDIELVPWKRLLLMTKTGTVFGSFSLFKTEERERFSLFTYPLHYSTFRLFAVSDNVFEFDTVKDLYGKRIGIAAGFSVSEELEAAQMRGELTVVEIFSFKDGFRRLLQGGIDAFIGNDLVVEHQIKQSLNHNPDLSQIVSLPKPIQDARGAYFVLSKKYPINDLAEWQRKITRELQTMDDEGLIDAIVKRYVR
jgi:polar amino acid transport system substrate-binding protein